MLQRTIATAAFAFVLLGCEKGPTAPKPQLHDGWAVFTETDREVLFAAAHRDGWIVAALPLSLATDNQGYDGVGAVLARTPDGREITVWLGDDGRPRRAVFSGVVVLFDRWTASTVDVAMIAQSGEIRIQRGVRIPPAVRGPLRATSTAGLGGGGSPPSALSVPSTRTTIGIAFTALDAGSCILAAIGATETFGALGALAGVTCGAAAFSIWNRWTAEDDPAIQASGAAYGLLPNLLLCAATQSTAECRSLLVTAFATILELGAEVVLDLEAPVRTAEGALRNGSGQVQITLTWNNTADLDLRVTDPSGTTIFWNNKQSATGGQLDVDDLDGYGPENIFWPTAGAPAGTYQVAVEHYSGSSPARYTVLVQAFGEVKTYSGTVTSGQRSTVLTFTSGSSLPLS